MKEKIIAKLGNKLNSLEIFIDDVYVVDVAGEKTLTIVLDSDHILDLKSVVKATRILNPIVDELDLIDGTYTLDVYAKEKGEIEDE